MTVNTRHAEVHVDREETWNGEQWRQSKETSAFFPTYTLFLLTKGCFCHKLMMLENDGEWLSIMMVGAPRRLETLWRNRTREQTSGS